MGNSLYERDFHAWTERQAELLRAGKFTEADIANIVEEIETMGRSERRELTNRLAVLLHLLKWRHQPAFRGTSWRLTIKAHRHGLKRHLRDNPSLQSRLDQTMADAYATARIEAERETGLAAETFPEINPFPFARAIDNDFWPDG